MKGQDTFNRTWIKGTLLVGLCLGLISCDSDTAPALQAAIDDGSLNRQPVQSVDPLLFDTNAELTFQLQEDTVLRGSLYHPEGDDEPQVVLRSLPSHGKLTLNSDNTVFLYELNPDYWGEDRFTYLTANSIEVSVKFVISPVNDPPVISPELARVAEQGRLFVTPVNAEDKDGDVLTFSASGLPDWLSIDSEAGVLSGLPSQSDIGMSDGITIRVTDSTGVFDELTDVSIEVIDVNDAPTLNLSQLPRELKARETITARVFPDDVDGDSVTLMVEPNKFVETSATDGSVTLTASDVNDVTDVNIVIKATDLQGRIARKIVPMTIYPLTESGNGMTLLGSKVGRGIPLLIMGDGYTIDQQDLFREHVDNVVNDLHADDGINAHLAAFNIHMINTVSLDSGADDNQQVDSRNTAFDSVYNCRSIPRLVCANSLSLFESALMEYGDVDLIILLVNDRRYGGSGNSGSRIAITSAYSPQIALHELGHSVANLADEYVDNLITESSGLSPFIEGEHANVTAISDPARVPWSHWIDFDKPVPTQPGDDGVGMFEGGLYRSSGIYRPTHDSRMRSYDAPFGPVNSEEWILRLYTVTGGLRGISPSSKTVKLNAGETAEFVVSPLFSEDIQTITWSLNGEVFEPVEDPNSISLTLPVGDHLVTAILRDISGSIRRPPPHAGIVNWTWQVSVR